MCEQTEVQYLEGDVVWVKLGPCWWPGQVKDFEKLPSEVVQGFKKKPLAVVQFFDEDSYEYVKNLNQIYKYNCRKKNEFIKKGLDLHRAKNAYMDKFPSDVCTAETLTGGDPDIITNDMFAPEQKPSYQAIFGSPSPKKTPKTPKGRPSIGSPKSTSASVTPQRKITHPRFVGKSDHEIRILEQKTPGGSTSHYTCYICGFESSRLNVIVLHNKSHSSGTYISPGKQKSRSKGLKKPKRMTFSNTTTIEEDLQLIRDGKVVNEEESHSESDDEDAASGSKKRKSGKKESSVSKKTKVSNICNNLLADWGDSDSEEEQAGQTNDAHKQPDDKQPPATPRDGDSAVNNKISSLLSDWNDKNSDEEKDDETNDHGRAEPKKHDEQKNSSCFDFNEEEDQTVLEKSPGRKIPRVIPQIRKSSEVKESDGEEKDREDEEGPPKLTDAMQVDNAEDEGKDKETEEAFKSILEETAVPELPPLLVQQKSGPPAEQKAATPDKKEEEKTNGVLKHSMDTSDDKESPERLTTPKKRFVRNFEDFENFCNEQKQYDEVMTKSESTLEVSKLKSQLMSKLTDVPSKSSAAPPEKPVPEVVEEKQTEQPEEVSEPAKETQKETEEPEVEKPLEVSEEPEVSQDVPEETPEEEPIPPAEPHEEEPDTVAESADKEELAAAEPEVIEPAKPTEPAEPAEPEATAPLAVNEETMEELESPKSQPSLEEKMETEPEDDKPEMLEAEPKDPVVDTSVLSDSNEDTKVKMLMNISDMCIDNSDNLSGLSTLAAVSELTGNFSYDTSTTATDSPTIEPDESKDAEPVSDEPKEEEKEKVEPVELKSAVTLANFSLDFSDSNNDSDIIKKDVAEEEAQEEIKETVEQVSQVPEDQVLEDKDLEQPETAAPPEEVPAAVGLDKNEPEAVTMQMDEQTNDLNKSPKVTGAPDFSVEHTNSAAAVKVKKTVPEPSQEQPFVNTESTLESEIAKLTDCHSDMDDVLHDQQSNTSSSKLLEILTESKSPLPDEVREGSSKEIARTIITTGTSQKVHMVITGDSKAITKKFDPKTSKFVIKSATSKAPMSKSSKPIILSEKIIKPVVESENVSVKKVTSKRTYQDVDDIDTFIIQKSVKKSSLGDGDQQDIILTPKSDAMKQIKSSTRSRGKPKIIEQTIIKAADVVSPQVSVAGASADTQQLLDDSMFDINSMPIVLSDQILTPEGIESMPVVMSDLIPSSSTVTTTVQSAVVDKPQQATPIKRGGAIQQVKLLNKSKPPASQAEATKLSPNVLVKNMVPRGLAKNQKVYQTGSTKLLKNNPAVITQPGKPGKFIILPSSTSSSSTGSKYTVGKRLQAVKNTSVISPGVSKSKVGPGAAAEPTGNKIMIVTNQQGVQSRVLLTPMHQKLLNAKGVGTKITKNPAQSMKGGVIHSKSILTSKGTILSSMSSQGLVTQKSPLVTQTVITSKGQQLATSAGQAMVTSEGQVLTPLTPQQLKTMKADAQKSGKKVQIQSQRVLLTDPAFTAPQKGKLLEAKTKTVLIKGQGGITKRIQSPVADMKNIYIQHGQKGGQLLLSGQQLQSTGKQMLITPKGQMVKADGKVGLVKQMGEKLVQKINSPKSVAATKILSKGAAKTQVLISPSGKQQLVSSSSVPPLSPISSQSKKAEQVHATPKPAEPRPPKAVVTAPPEPSEKHVEPQQPPAQQPAPQQQQQPAEQKQAQLVINDGVGSQIFTEGQIFAVPSETIDGQPQSYVLVTVDEAGNLTPLNNEALMSLDPSLALTGEMGNVVLQFDQGTPDPPAETKMETLPTELAADPAGEQQQLLTMDGQHLLLPDQAMMSPATTDPQMLLSDGQHQDALMAGIDEAQVATSDTVSLAPETQAAVSCSIGSGENSQQLIITGDPDMAQKFLVQLSEGNADLNSLLSGAEGNIIINADGQQILLNTDPDNQILLMNNENMGLMQGGADADVSQSAMFVAQQAIKNQDILAAALADTDVFQPDAAAAQAGDKPGAEPRAVVSSQAAAASQAAASQVAAAPAPAADPAPAQLSPCAGLYPLNPLNPLNPLAAGVLQTSLTLGSPIMTPLEVPSVPSKKINPDLEASLLTQVPSSLELPITITDPSISQTVSQQVMLGGELQPGLDMPLPIPMSEAAITSIRSAEISSPSFVYSLPSLDEHVGPTDHSEHTEHADMEGSPSPVITSEGLYATSLAGPMSMPLLTEEPDLPSLQPGVADRLGEPQPAPDTDASPEANAVVEAAAEVVPDANDTAEPDVAPDLDQAAADVAPETPKLPTDLPIPIEEELDLNPNDICNSLSEPPPGMFDKSSFSLSLSPKHPADKPDEPEGPAQLGDEPRSRTDSCTEDTLLPSPACELPAEEAVRTELGIAEPAAAGATDAAADYLEPMECVADKQEEVAEEDTAEPGGLLQLEEPADADESSCEIPVQPPIVTKLSGADSLLDIPLPPEPPAAAVHGRKRDVHDDDGASNKRTKLSCD